MGAAAGTPEELDALLEDAFVLRDRDAVAELFEDGAVLAAGDGAQARGAGEIARAAAALWEANRTYVAGSRRVLQARDTALVVADRAIAVMRRGHDRTWRYVIALLSVDSLDDAAPARRPRPPGAGRGAATTRKERLR